MDIEGEGSKDPQGTQTKPREPAFAVSEEGLLDTGLSVGHQEMEGVKACW